METPKQIVDVIVVGAGPAGGHCARLVAKQGRRVLLVDRLRVLEENAFSSAATVISVLNQFDLPNDVVGTYWNDLCIMSTQHQLEWSHPQQLGVVLDFAKLRKFLAEDAKKHGADILLGYEYIRHDKDGEFYNVTLQDRSSRKIRVYCAKVVVDATGPNRSVMKFADAPLGPILQAVGIEWLIDVGQEQGPPFNRLIFLLGKKWAPGGYGWVFPMNNGTFKVGVCRYLFSEDATSRELPLRDQLSVILKEFFPTSKYTILDTHGGNLKLSIGLKNSYYKGGILAIGDAVSTVNPLGGEGIRHGMMSACFAAKAINSSLKGFKPGFLFYQWRMKASFWLKWRLSEYLMFKVYRDLSDASIDRGVQMLRALPMHEMIRILFHYKYFSVFRILIGKLKRRAA